MHRTTAVTAALFTVLLAGGCSSGDGGGDGKAESTPAAASSSPTASESETAATAPKLSAEWSPKLQAATAGDHDDVCKTVGSQACVDHITKLTELVYDVRDAIDTAGATASYPDTVEAIGKVEDASAAYAEGGCAGSSEATLAEGSECGGWVATLLFGPASVDLTMTTDELTAP